MTSEPERDSRRDREIDRLRSEGLTLREIGERLGEISRQRVHQILSRNGYYKANAISNAPVRDEESG